MNEIGNKFMIDSLMINNEDFLRDLLKEELLYVHLFCIGKYQSDEAEELFRKSINYQDYLKCLKKDFKIKNTKKESIIEDIITSMSDTDGLQIDKYFDFKSFEIPPSVPFISKEYEYLAAIFSLMNHICKKEIQKLNENEFENYINKLSNATVNRRLNFNIVKIAFLIYNIDNIIDIKKFNVDEQDIFYNLIVALNNNYILLTKNNISLIDNIKNQIDNITKSCEKQLQTKEENIKKLKEENKNTVKKEKDTEINKKQILDLTKTLKSIEDKVKKQSSGNDNIIKELKNYKASVSKAAYESQIDKLTNQISDLKLSLKEKSIEVKEAKNKLDYFETNIVEKFVNYVQNNGIPDEVYKIINEVKNISENNIIETDNNSEDINNKPLTEEDEIKEYIGYSTIENNEYYINLINGKKEKIYNLPEFVYLAENQFILTDTEFNFKFSFQSRYENNGIPISDLIIVPVIGENPLKVKMNGKIIELKTNYENFRFKPNQILGLDSNYNIVRMFKFTRTNADALMPSIISKGHKAYYVLRIMNSGMFLRNIETEHEDFLKIDSNGYDVKEKSVICVKDDKVMNMFNSGKFYTSSSYYKDKISYVVIEIKDSTVYGKKITTGETIKINNVPFEYILKDNDLVAIDEFNSFLFVKNSDDIYTKSVNKKLEKQSPALTKTKESIDIKSSVTILGNPGFENSYKLAFLKYGFKVIMIDGYEKSFTRIIQGCKDSEYIICTTAFLSHDNMWKVKEEKDAAFSNKKIFFPDYDGANRLVQLIQESQENEKELNEEKEISI